MNSVHDPSTADPSTADPSTVSMADRRQFIQRVGHAAIAGGLVTGLSPHSLLGAAAAKKKVGAVITVYKHNSHADVILTKILEGWRHDGGTGPDLELAALYVDQFPAGDMARDMAKKHGFPIVERIEDAVTLGGADVAVDGVLSIGEHGTYPSNDLGQHLYPRRRFLEGILSAFRKADKVVPVFTDKHLGPQWDDAVAMYQQTQKLGVPFMAGSSIPVSFRKPDLDLPVGTKLDAAVGVGYGGLESYGFHTLELFQTLVERRSKRETGIRSVTCLTGDKMIAAVNDGTVDRQLLDRAIETVPHNKRKKIADLKGDNTGVFVLEYADGFRGTVLMLQGLTAGFGTAIRRTDGTVQACEGEGRSEPRYPHFSYLLFAIQKMIETGKPSYPVERTLLTSGVLDAVLHSRRDDGSRRRTPELLINYDVVDYPYAEKVTLPGEDGPWS